MSATARRPIGVGVIGFGWLGQAHSRSLARIPMLFADRTYQPRLVACSDALQVRVDQAVSSFGFDRGSVDWRAVVEDPDVEVVFIAAPNMLHGELVAAVAGAGRRCSARSRSAGPPRPCCARPRRPAPPA
jgi:predicted dehydrogenase